LQKDETISEVLFYFSAIYIVLRFVFLVPPAGNLCFYPVAHMAINKSIRKKQQA
jgi:hypothetical protein